MIRLPDGLVKKLLINSIRLYEDGVVIELSEYADLIMASDDSYMFETIGVHKETGDRYFVRWEIENDGSVDWEFFYYDKFTRMKEECHEIE